MRLRVFVAFVLMDCVVNSVVRVFLGRIRALGFAGFARSLVLKLCRRPFRIYRRGKQLRSMRFSWALLDSASTNWWLVLLLFASFLEILLLSVIICFGFYLGSKLVSFDTPMDWKLTCSNILGSGAGWIECSHFNSWGMLPAGIQFVGRNGWLLVVGESELYFVNGFIHVYQWYWCILVRL